jgi:hypothetical protein
MLKVLGMFAGLQGFFFSFFLLRYSSLISGYSLGLKWFCYWWRGCLNFHTLMAENIDYILLYLWCCHSFSTFDFQEHGNTHYGSPYSAPRNRRSSQGKMEKSLLRYGLGKLVVLRHIDDIVHSLLFQKISQVLLLFCLLSAKTAILPLSFVAQLQWSKYCSYLV